MSISEKIETIRWLTAGVFLPLLVSADLGGFMLTGVSFLFCTPWLDLLGWLSATA